MGLFYEIECKMCGTPLLYIARLDNSFDLFVEVEPCPECIDDAVADDREKHDS